jgi:hypothetical protein
VASFYHGLFTYRLATKESVQQMTRWHNMTEGWGSGAQYGMGLLQVWRSNAVYTLFTPFSRRFNAN